MTTQQAAPNACPSEGGGIILRPAATEEPEDDAAASTTGEPGDDTSGGSIESAGASAIPAPSRIDSGGGFLAERRSAWPLTAWLLVPLAGAAAVAAGQRRRRRA